MRSTVILLNILAVCAGVLMLPLAIYIGIWGVLGGAYNQPEETVLGVLIMLAPIVIPALCIVLSLRALHRGSHAAPVVAAIPLVLSVIAVFTPPLSSLFGH